MTEYINTTTLLKEIDHAFHTDIIWKKDVINLIINLPVADVTPVLHGRWIEQEKYTFGVMYDCSICGDRILDNGHSWNYCPNCGCRMDGGAD